VPPVRDEHQLVRDAAGELAHQATSRTTLFALGAGAPTRLRCPEGAVLSPPYTRKMIRSSQSPTATLPSASIRPAPAMPVLRTAWGSPQTRGCHGGRSSPSATRR